MDKMSVLEKAARALAELAFQDEALCEREIQDRIRAEWRSFVPEARAVLLAVRDDLQGMRVHTDGYAWKRGHNGPFVLWEDIDAILENPNADPS